MDRLTQAITNLDYLEGLIRQKLDKETMPGMLRLTAGLRADRHIGGRIYLGLLRAPAAKGNHHDHEGGLVLHLTEMWNLYVILAEGMKTTTGIMMKTPQISDANVLMTIIAHDLHKALTEFYLISDEPWQVERDEDLPTNCMLSDDQKSRMLLAEYNVKLPLDVEHALWWSEGGFTRRERVAWRTPLATLVYLLDELSGNVLDKIRQGRNYHTRNPMYSIDTYLEQK